MRIENFNIGDTIEQSRNRYLIKSKNDDTQRVQVEHCASRYICEFEYGSEFNLVKEASKDGVE